MITFQKLWRKTPRTPNLQSTLWGAGYAIPGSLLTGRQWEDKRWFLITGSSGVSGWLRGLAVLQPKSQKSPCLCMSLIPNEKTAFTYPTQSPGNTSTENLSRCTGSKDLLWKVSVHAKLLQSCLTLCNPTGSSVHGDSPDKNTGEGCHALLQGSSRPRDRTCISCASCIGRWVSLPLSHL